MKLKQVLQKQDHPIEHVYFPGGGAFSVLKILSDGKAAEVAKIGAEGASGAGVFFGQRLADYEVLVQVAGPSAQRMSVELFNAEMERHGAFFNRVLRYNQALMSQVMQTTICNGLHSAEERCCRWLLMSHDRAGADEFAVTHEFLAMMLGVRRPTVTIVANYLQDNGLIQYRRGAITILDRAKLEAASCECYGTVRDQMRRLLPEVAFS